MKRLFGFGKKRKQKKRLSPSEVSPPDGFQATSPMYQYARNEFAQTVASGTSNDDGRGILYTSPSETPSKLFTRSTEMNQPGMVPNAASSHSNNTWMSPVAAQHENDQSSHVGPAQDYGQFRSPQTGDFETNLQPHQLQPGHSASLITSRNDSLIDTPVDQSLQVQRQTATAPSYEPPKYSMPHSPGQHQQQTHFNNPNSPSIASNTNATLDTVANANIDPDYIEACSASNLGRQESLFSQASSQYPTNNSNRAPNSIPTYKNQYLDFPPNVEMPDATYEEEYGDAYIGGPIRYVYPSGYQSMRPRSGPWKLSIVICMLFTWLSVFIVGHCSDRVDTDVSQYNQNEIDDDTLVIETRWCGSRLLYMMWVISMLVTGLAAAYCSIIGYIKVRDFAVANSRSQPPGIAGKTDFYAQVDDAAPPPIQETSSHGSFASSHHKNHYHVPIYQADGNPQFWGGHIYRPTQAAVAITSR